jgi:hypothetical protein
VSKTTAEAWAKWRIAHPNWKPAPNLHRPQYVMTRQESIDKVAFACSVPLIDTWYGGLFAETDVPPPLGNFPPMTATQITLPNETPPEVAESWPPLEPFETPTLGGIPASGGMPQFLIAPPPGGPTLYSATAEPGSLTLAGTGMMALACLMLASRRRTEKAEF